MSIDKVIENVTPEIYQRMQDAVATGKWPNGIALTEDQRANCLQIIIAYDALNKSVEERVGYLPEKPANSPRRRDQSDETRPVRLIED